MSTSSLPLSSEEQSLYDRQLRVWGAEAQHRLRSSHVLLLGVGGLGNEIAKNLVLTGVGGLTLWDEKHVTEEDLSSCFFLTKDNMGSNRALACEQRIQALNPHVKVVGLSGDNKEWIGREKLNKYQAVVCTAPHLLSTVLSVSSLVRAHSIPVWFATSHGFYSLCVSDLVQHGYTVDKKADNKETHTQTEKTSIQQQQIYIPLTQLFDHNNWLNIKQWIGRKQLDREAFSIFIHISMTYKYHQHQQQQQHNNTQSTHQIKITQEQIQAFVESLSLPPGIRSCVDLSVLFGMISLCDVSLSSCCSIFGGLVSQEVVKVLSGKEAPHQNSIIFNARRGTAVVKRLQTNTDLT